MDGLFGLHLLEKNQEASEHGVFFLLSVFSFARGPNFSRGKGAVLFLNQKDVVALFIN